MQTQTCKLADARPGDCCAGFRLVKSEYVASKAAQLYTLRHEKTGAELLYFDRADENKTFAICFKTLPENDTGVFHILEHSVLNGSRKFPVKEPFVSLLQSSMQTFLNAMTFSDKTLYPVSSRSEQDLFNLMAVYLDGVFCPLIYERPEIFRQEGWHYEFDAPGEPPRCNGVVYSEMKGAYADVDRLMEDEITRMLFPDSSYGYASGGHPAHIPELSYRQFLDTHARFYHPSNAKIILDGHMDVDAALRYIDGEYLSKYDDRAPDFDFVLQKPVTAERTIHYEAREGEKALAHVVASKILCTHKDVEKIYAARILSDYLTGSNEAPLKRAFLEQGLAQDVGLDVSDGVYQPYVSLVVRNTSPDSFDAVRALLPQCVSNLLEQGLDGEALSACLDRAAFSSREISEPYGIELTIRALDGWLYGDDPLTHIDNAGVFDALREKLSTSYFSDLLAEMLAQPEQLSWLYALPSVTKGQEDAREEAARMAAAAAAWDEQQAAEMFRQAEALQQWQQQADTEEALATLPHLQLCDVPEQTPPIRTQLHTVAGTQLLKVEGQTSGIVYLNLYFDVSDFTLEELRLLNVLTACFGELRTEHYAADVLQNRVKAALGALDARVELVARPGDLTHCKPYLLVSASMLQEKASAALALLTELLTCGKYDETGRIYETVLQSDYFLKQGLISSGHSFAITRSLASFSRAGAMHEALSGESFARWFSDFAAHFEENQQAHRDALTALAARAFASNRLFTGCSGLLDDAALEPLVQALPKNEIGPETPPPQFDAGSCAIEIPADVGFSALGHNLYALGGKYTGACTVLSSLMTYSYLWNAVRVQGGAYGTGMSVRMNGDMFCYSYRDPALEASRAAFGGLADYLEEFLRQEAPLDDLIISTVNATDPLLDPAGHCALACTRYLKGITDEAIARIRREILHTSAADLAQLTGLLRTFAEQGAFCAVGGREDVAFAKA